MNATDVDVIKGKVADLYGSISVLIEEDRPIAPSMVFKLIKLQEALAVFIDDERIEIK